MAEAFNSRSVTHRVSVQQVKLMAHQKSDLPEKLCPVCERPFQWRKKWAKVWDDVKFCSDRCRRNKSFSADLVSKDVDSKSN